jgi:hypothetical protein
MKVGVRIGIGSQHSMWEANEKALDLHSESDCVLPSFLDHCMILDAAFVPLIEVLQKMVHSYTRFYPHLLFPRWPVGMDK